MQPFQFTKLVIRQGFTLIELLLSIAFIAFLAGVSIPLWQQLQVRNDIDVTQQALVASIRRSQLLAQANVGDNPWGIKIQPGTVTIFQGSSYANRLPTQDESFGFSSSITASGLSEVVFSKVFAEPSVTGGMIFTTVTNEARTTTIGAKGMVNY